jgi:hypothetical protein
MLDYHKIGMAFFEPLQNNYFADQMFDSWMWIMVKMMYAPYGLPAQLGEVEEWAKNVSLNGARWTNMCNPNL